VDQNPQALPHNEVFTPQDINLYSTLSDLVDNYLHPELPNTN